MNWIAGDSVALTRASYPAECFYNEIDADTLHVVREVSSSSSIFQNPWLLMSLGLDKSPVALDK